VSDIASLGIMIGVQGVKEAQQQLDGLTKSGAAAEKQTQKIAPAMEKTSLSAKQLRQATQGLPAQFTDIATSLGSGQRPLQVLLQQGGQLKDMFGGVGPALRATGSYALGLVNPLTLAAAGAAALALAWKQGSDESVAFNKALILTGNYAGLTADALQDMSAEIDKVAGTQHAAAAALAEVASTGRFTAEQIELVARASEQMRIATGRDVSETVKEFVKLEGDPVRAILELNEKYHFLTDATYEQIKALQDQGREQDAATLAIKTYANEIGSRTGDIRKNLGLLERSWASLKGWATEAWDAMLGVGRSATTNDKIKQLQEKIESFQNPTFGSFASQTSPAARAKVIATFRKQLAELQGSLRAESAKASRGSLVTAANEAAIAFDQEARQYASREEKRVRELTAARGRANDAIRKALASGNKKLAEDIRKDLATIESGINEKYKDRARTRKPRAETDPAGPILARIRQQIALNKEELSSQEKLTVSDRLRISVQQQLEELKGKVTGARKAEIEAMLEELKASGDLLEKQQQEIKTKEALARLTRELAQEEENRRRANEVDLLALAGVGQEATAQKQRLLDIDRWYQDQVKRLNDLAAQEKRKVSKEEEDELKAAHQRMLSEESVFQKKRLELQADWRNGARAATADFISEQQNIAGQTYDIFRNLYSGLSDLITDFITTGKGDWKGFFDDLAKQITAFIVKQQLSKWLKSLSSQGSNLPGQAEAGGGFWAGLVGALFGGGSAKGNAFMGGDMVHAFANGGVPDGPRMFPMARGRWGVMNEGLHKEAIIPLHRGSDGKLGVRMDGGERTSPTSVVQNFTQVVQGLMTSRTAEQAARLNGREAARGMSRTGR
jgi:lambda family phage tail tape measure protein